MGAPKVREPHEMRASMHALEKRALLKPLHDICRGLHCTIEDVLSGIRTKQVVRAREACFSHCADLGFSYVEIGILMGFDHTTVLDAVKRHRGRQDV